VPLLEIPHLQLGARGAAIDFLFYSQATDGTRTPQDLSTAVPSECFALYRKPRNQADGAPFIVRTQLAIVDAPAGRARYVTEDGFLDQAGDWFAQGFVVFAGTPTSFIPSEVVALRIKANLRPFSVVPLLSPSSVPIAVGAPAVTRS
jgi:hypothetical protein